MEQKKQKSNRSGSLPSKGKKLGADQLKTTFGDKKAKRGDSAKRKKGMPKWKNTVAEID